MIEVVHHMWSALPLVLAPQVMLAMAIGVTLGIVIGALPGLSTTMGIAVLIPLTFAMPPLVALGMIAGIYNGGMYGGSIAAILLRIPGTPAAIATVFDGYPMAQQGRANLALRISLVSSTLGSLASAIALLVVAPPLAAFALKFGPAEYFWLAVFGLAVISFMLSENVAKGLLSACLGLFCGSVGIDQVTGITRFTFGSVNLLGGIGIIVFLTGLYAIPPALELAEKALLSGITAQASLKKGKSDIRWSRFIPTWIRGIAIGIVCGTTPAIGGNIAALMSWNETRRSSKDPSRFGKGAPEGVAASECANNADTGATLIPTLTLGIPGNAVSAVIMGALLVQGLRPGPGLLQGHPNVVYGFMLTMLISAVLLYIIGRLGARIYVNVLKVPEFLLAPGIIILTVVGIYSIHNSMFDVWLMLCFGAIGYVMEKLDISLVPAVLAIILGPIAEVKLRLAMRISHGDPTYLFHSVISIIMVILVILVVFTPAIRKVLQRLKRQRNSQA